MMLYYHDLGRMDYLAACALQERLVTLKQRKNFAADLLLFVEHPHVYTLGRGGKESNVLAADDVAVYRTIDLRSKLRKNVHRYVRNLELAAIRTLKDFGLASTRRPPFTGIWIGGRKIAAIGVAVRRGITFHGLALNVNTNLAYFDRIVPCGLSWAGVTSMAKELGTEPRMDKVREAFLHHFAELFGYSGFHESLANFDLQAVQKGSSYEAS